MTLTPLQRFSDAAGNALTAAQQVDTDDQLYPIHAELCAVFGSAAAELIEQHFRPPLPERLKVKTANLRGRAAGL